MTKFTLYLSFAFLIGLLAFIGYSSMEALATIGFMAALCLSVFRVVYFLMGGE